MILKTISEELLNQKLGVTFFNSLEFIRGEADCIAGNPHRSGQTREYDLGYGRRYELEAQADHKTEKTK